MKPSDLIKTAKILSSGHRSRPRQSDLLRATSTAYYAVFHTLARNCADMVVGSSKGATRSENAWKQVYRAVEHRATKNACQDRNMIGRFPNTIQDFASAFTTLQSKRHSADYDPHVTAYKDTVEIDIALAEQAIEDLKCTSIKDRRAFAAYILLKIRKN